MVKMLIGVEEKQRRSLIHYSKKVEKPVSKIIRNAIDEFLYKRITDVSFKDALKMAAGIWKDRNDIGNGVDYVNKMRKEHTISSVERIKRHDRT